MPQKKKRNPIARLLAQFKPRTIRSKRTYNRKRIKQNDQRNTKGPE